MSKSSLLGSRAVLLAEVICLVLAPLVHSWGDEFPPRDVLLGRVISETSPQEAELARSEISEHLANQGVDLERAKGYVSLMSDQDAIEISRYPESIVSGKGIPLGLSILIILVITVLFFELINEDIGLASLEVESKQQLMARLGGLPWAPEYSNGASRNTP